MKKRFSTTILQSVFLFGLLCLANTSTFSQTAAPFSISDSPLPAPTSPVMDYAAVLDANAKQALENKIIAFRDSSNPKVELAVAIVQTTGDRDISDYSLAVSRGWKIGSKDQDNPSALLLIAVNDRKYYTQVSRDLEDELPDGLVGQLQRQNLVPAFRQQNYGKGISDTIDAYISTIQSKQTGAVAPPTGATEHQPKRNKSSLSVCGVGICLIVLIFIILPLLSRSSKKRGGKDDDDWGGGGFGGGAASTLPWVIGSILASGGSRDGSSSGGWGGGGSSGGDSGWGGFGGGGDFGGGGAGGDW